MTLASGGAAPEREGDQPVAPTFGFLNEDDTVEMVRHDDKRIERNLLDESS